MISALKAVAIALIALSAFTGCVSEDLHEECSGDGDCVEGKVCAFRNCVADPACPVTDCPAVDNADAVSCAENVCRYTCQNGFEPIDMNDATRATGCR